MHNDHFLVPLQSFSYNNTVGAVARLFFSDPPLTPYATIDKYSLHLAPGPCVNVRILEQ